MGIQLELRGATMTWNDIIEQKVKLFKGDCHGINRELTNNFNKVLLHHIEKHNVSQMEIVRALNITPVTVHRWVINQTYPTLKNLRALKGFFETLERKHQ